MKKIAFLLLFLLYLTPLFAGDFSASGYLKNETALGTKDKKVAKLKNIFQIAAEQKINDNWAMFVSGRYWYDSAYGWYAIRDRAQHYMQHTQRADWLRDCYLDYTSEKLDMRLGRQQVAWGQANGITVLDRVNPVDLTEFWLQDFVDLRIPLWMANVKYSPKVDSNLQILIIPDFEASTAAPPGGSPFVFRSYTLFDDFRREWDTNPNAVITLPAFLRRPLRVNTFYPSKQFRNSKFGLQWQDIIAGWQYTLNYLHGYDPLGRTYHEGTDPTVAAPGVSLVFSRRFKIVQVVGGSLNHTFTSESLLKGLTFRGDAAVYLNEPTYIGDVTSGDAKFLERWNNVFWLMGLDKIMFTKWLVSFQFAQYILEHSRPTDSAANGQNLDPMNAYSYGAQDGIENIFTLRVATNFMHERLQPGVDINLSDDGDGRISPKVVYQLRDNLWFTLGMHYFYGDEHDTFGQFNQSNQVYVHLKYTF